MPSSMACLGDVIRTGLALQADLALRRRVDAEQALGQLRPTGALNAGQAQNLLAVELEGDVLQPRGRLAQVAARPGSLRTGAPDAGRPSSASISPTIMRTTSSVVSSAVGRVATCRPLRSTVTMSVSSITSLKMWLTNRMVVPSPQGAKDLEEGFHLTRREGRRRLVQNEEAALLGEGLDDAGQLLLGDAQLAHRPPRDRGPSARSARGAPPWYGPPSPVCRPARLACRWGGRQEDVLGDGQIGTEGDLLVDHGDTRRGEEEEEEEEEEEREREGGGGGGGRATGREGRERERGRRRRGGASRRRVAAG